MEIRDLRYFCLTAELEHVTKAADKLGVAQPFLTKIIRQLEKEIGVPLFDNIGRTIKLNAYGKTFYTHAKKILMEVENLHEEMDTMLGHHERTLKILSNIESHYPEIVVAYQKLYPNYALSVSYASREDMISALKSGEADFAVCSPPLSDDPEKGIKTDIIFCEYSCILLPPNHPALAQKTICIGDLDGEPLVTTPQESGLRINLERIMEKYSYHPQIVCESNDMNLIIRTVRGGLGYAIIPRTVMFSNPSIKKFCVEADVPDSYGYIGLSYSTSPSDSRDSSEFRDFIIKFLKEYSEKVYSKRLD
ncbi:MAG: LysR family transcriptional regulator [Oscillospiraceae bacterium]